MRLCRLIQRPCTALFDYAEVFGVASQWKPIRLCAPSQNGRFSLAPQRHKPTVVLPVKSHALPSTSHSTIGPSTRNDPFGRTVIFTGSDINFLHEQTMPQHSSPQSPARKRLAGAHLHQVDRIDIHDEVAPRNCLRCRVGQHCAQSLAKHVSPLGLQHKVEAIDAFDPRDGRGCGA